MLGRRALAQAARRATGSRLRRADRLSSRRTRRTIRPRARRAPACGVFVPGALRRARRAWPHVPLPGTRAASMRRWPLAGNGAITVPGSFIVPAARRAAGGTPHASGALSRPSHNAGAMCCGCAPCAHQLAARGGSAPERRASSVRPTSAGGSSCAPSARSLKARHAPCVASARGICGSRPCASSIPRAGTARAAPGPALAGACPRGGRARRASAARRRPAEAACALPALYRRGRRPPPPATGLARRARVRREDRARTRDRAHAPSRAMTGLRSSRGRARTARPRRVYIAHPLCKRSSEARPGGERAAPAERSAAGHESAGDDKRVYRQAGLAARVPGEGPRKGPRARALPRVRRHQPLSPEPPGALSLRSCSSSAAVASGSPARRVVSGHGVCARVRRVARLPSHAP